MNSKNFLSVIDDFHAELSIRNPEPAPDWFTLKVGRELNVAPSKCDVMWAIIKRIAQKEGD